MRTYINIIQFSLKQIEIEYIINIRQPIIKKVSIKMQQQKKQDPVVPQHQIISMIEQFIGCLNYPNTKATLARQKYKNQLKDQHVIKEENEVEQVQKKEAVCQVGSIQQNVHSMEQKKVESLMEEKQLSKIQDQNLNKDTIEKQNQFRWKGQQAKFYSKFASFSEIVYCLETSSNQRQLANIKFIQNQMMDTNNQILNSSNNEPSLLHIFSAFDASSKVKLFTIPIYRTLTLESKFSKPVKFMEASPKQNILCVVDQQSTIVIVNLLQQCVIQFLRPEQDQSITAIKWLKSGSILAIASKTSKSAKINIYTVYRNKQIEKLITLTPHLLEITSMYCTRDYLYTCSADFTFACIYIRFWKVQKITKLKGNYLIKMAKIQHKKLKDIIFGIEMDGQELVMIDQITGFCTTIFSIKRNHVSQCRKASEKKDEKFDTNFFLNNCWISDLLTNHDNSSLIISVAGVNPSIYEVDPLRNQCILRLNYRNLKTVFLPANDELLPYQRIPNICIDLYHKSQILIVTTNSNNIFYVRIKNWRILHEYIEQQKGMNFTYITATRRYPEADQSILLHHSQIQIQLSQIQKQTKNGSGKLPKIATSESKSNSAENKQGILCVYNTHNSNIQVYYNKKGTLKTIKSDIQRSRPLLSHAFGLTNGTQGFLELLHTIRENYQAFNT